MRTLSAIVLAAIALAPQTRTLVGVEHTAAGGAPITKVQCVSSSNISGSSHTTQAVTLANTTAGDAIAVTVLWLTNTGFGTGITLSTVATAGNSFTVPAGALASVTGNPDSDTNAAQYAYVTNITGETTPTVTATFSASVSRSFMTACEVSHANFDQVAQGTGTTGTAASAGSVTVNSGSFLMAAAQTDDGNGTGTITAGSGWTGSAGDATLLQVAGGNWVDASQYKLNGSGSVTCNMTLPRNGHWAVTCGVLKP